MGMHKNKLLRNTLGMLVSFVVFTGCSSDGPVIEQPEQQYYEIAQSRMRAKNYFSAIDSLEMIVTRYPFGRYAEQAQSELIYVHFMNGDDEAAHAATEKFIRLHPRHPNIDYAYFMRGITSYTRDKSFFARLFEDNLPKRDISGAKQSFSELSEFLTRFPDSQYAPYANQRLIYLRNMIAKHELTAADYYLRREAYIAALRRAKYVLEHIPNSSENLRALNILKVAYENLGYLDLLEDVEKTIVINYPNQELEDSKTESRGFWPFNREAPKPPQQES